MAAVKILFGLIHLMLSLSAVKAFTFEGSTKGSFHLDRRNAIALIFSSAAVAVPTILPTLSMLVFHPSTAIARTPGSTDANEAVIQIRDGASDLRKLMAEWDLYTRIDAEGRAGDTNGARRILGGIAPQAGISAIEYAKATPLYRIDGAFQLVRKAVLSSETSWAEDLELDKFEELADRVVYAVTKADGNFYSVLFAAKGTTMIENINKESYRLVNQAISDMDEMLLLLKKAGAPEL